MSSKKILIITPGFPADEQDNTCIPPLQLLVKEWNKMGHTVSIIAIEYPYSDAPYFWQGNAVFPCNGQNRKIRILQVFYHLLKYRKFIEKNNSFDIIYSFWLGKSWLLGRFISWRSNKPHFTIMMGQDVLMKMNRFYLQFLSVKSARNCIAVSAFQAVQFTQNTGLKPGSIIPWGVEENGISEPVEMRTIDVLGVGSLIPVKQWELWINVIADLQKRKPEIKAVLVGNGPEIEQLKALSRDSGLAKNIHFSGEIPRDEVLELMKDSRVLLHTSTFESFGMVLIEAAGMGCSVVSTPVGIANEVGAVSDTAEGLKNLVWAALNQRDKPSSQQPFLIQRTAKAYLALIPGETQK